ncbi:MAG: type II secretion system secretin GspD [Pseudomonadota bacterium]
MKTRNWHSFLLAVLLAMAAPFAVAEEGEFTLSLKNSDIHSLIGTVSKQTGRNFVVDPRVKAKVTVISSQPMGADELYEVFLSVLQVHGFSAVPTGDVIKIVPDVSAKQGPVPNLGSGGERDQLVTHVIRIDNVPAAQLVPILRPLVPQQGHLAAYASTNSLVITDRAANIQRLIGIIKRIDRPDNEEIEFVRLLHASATEVVRILNSLQKTAGAAQAGGAPGATRLAADERTNSVLISGDRASRLRMRGLIASLDTPLESGGNTKVIYLKYANAVDLATILKGVSAGQAKVGATTGSGTSSAAAGSAEAAQAAAAAAARRRASSNNTAGTTTVDIQADEHTNALIITAPPDEMRNVLAVVRQLDIRRAQVLVEAIIAEISDDKSRELGVSFGADGRGSNDPVGFSNLGGGVDQAAAIGSGLATSVGSGLSLALGSFDNDGTNFGFLVRAIASDANNNILSTPSLVTLDNEEAEIVVGQNVPFVTGQTTSASNDNPFQTIERQDVGLTLKVKPQINEGSSIKMEIDQEVSNVTSTSLASDIITNKRSIKTTVLVEDGQTLVLGGLIQDDLRDTQEKVPLLGDIPLLGRLFQYRNTVKAKQNLMVFLHPTILQDRDTADYYSSEKYSALRARQLVADEEGIGLLEDATPILPELEVIFNGRKLGVTSSTQPPKPVAAQPTSQTTEDSGTSTVAVATPVTAPAIEPTPVVVPEPEVEPVVVAAATPKSEPEPAAVEDTTSKPANDVVEPAPEIVTTETVASAPEPEDEIEISGQVTPAESNTGPARVNGLRIGEWREHTRIVLDMDGDPGERVERVLNPDGSISVTLRDSRLQAGFAVPDREIFRIKQLVIDQQESTVYIHVVPSQSSILTYQTLPRNDQGNYRFLIDVKNDTSLAANQEG